MAAGFLSRYRDPILVLVLLALPLVFYLANDKDPRDHNVVDRVVVFVSAPVQWMVVGALDGVSSAWRRYVALMGVERKNEALEARVQELESRLATREELVRENQRLRRLLGVSTRTPEIPMVYAAVVATSPTPLFRSLRINRGASDGVEVGAPVINHDGIVGRVAAVSTDVADVMLIVDANSSLDVLVQRTRARARIRGNGRSDTIGIEVEQLARTADVEPGDVLITSGTGDTFPKGIPVGRVREVAQPAFGLYQSAQVAPSVDFDRIEDVMVLPRAWPRGATFELPVGPSPPLDLVTSPPDASASAPTSGRSESPP